MLTTLSESKINVTMPKEGTQLFDSLNDMLLDRDGRELWCGKDISTLSASVRFSQISTEVEVTI